MSFDPQVLFTPSSSGLGCQPSPFSSNPVEEMESDDKLNKVLAAVNEINLKLSKITSDMDNLSTSSDQLRTLYSSLDEKIQANDHKHEDRWRDVE